MFASLSVCDYWPSPSSCLFAPAPLRSPASFLIFNHILHFTLLLSGQKETPRLDKYSWKWKSYILCAYKTTRGTEFLQYFFHSFCHFLWRLWLRHSLCHLLIRGSGSWSKVSLPKKTKQKKHLTAPGLPSHHRAVCQAMKRNYPLWTVIANSGHPHTKLH